MAITDLLQWSAFSAQGIEHTDQATYPTQETTADRYYVPYDDGQEEAVVIEGVMPQGYVSTIDLKLDVYYYAVAAAGTVVFDVFIEAISDGDGADMDAGSSFDAANQNSDAVPGTAGWPGLVSVTLTNKDSVAAGDQIRIIIERDDDDAADNLVGDCNATQYRLYQES